MKKNCRRKDKKGNTRMSCKITKDDLSNFYGTSQWYIHWTRKLKYTDGIHFLCENGAAWLIDAIASYQGEKKLQTRGLKEFQVWELKVKDKKGILTCKADSGIPPVITQEIEYTDFPFDISIWVEGGVALLPSEH
jgi:hypothetical protein